MTLGRNDSGPKGPVTFIKDEDTSMIPDMGPSPHPSMDNISITEAGVYQLLSNLQVHKAMGPDEIPTRLLKELAEELTPIFTLFYQASVPESRNTVLQLGFEKGRVLINTKKGIFSVSRHAKKAPIS